ncbi:hypothetical protein L2E82_23112 [Cichorium intybus]|uniref:Uncharacterized protein n=1 Tax=Cichorium intybus TaxID=13427 RepID=A0ACB9E0B5_CICIN|nr:hypothetical protein L2E82_23112 [Cichorium intybus]
MYVYLRIPLYTAYTPILIQTSWQDFICPGDPYFPEEGNRGWLNEGPEEEPEEVPKEEPEEVSEEEDQWEDEDSDDEPEVINPRYPTRDIHAPPPPPAFQSREQGLRPPYGMSHDYFDLSEGGSADRAFPVMIRRISRQEEWIRATSSQVMDVGATAEVAVARLRRLDETHDHTSGRVDSLEEDGRTAMGMFREAFVRISESEERIRDVERRAEEAEQEAADLRAQVDALRRAGRSGSP